MKFELKKGQILNALQIAQSAIPNKTTLQILNNFLLKVEGPNLEITATDLDLTIILKIPTDSYQDGSVVVNARKLLEVIRELPDLPVFFSVDDLVLTIKSGDSFQCNLTGFDASEYPSLPEEEDFQVFDLPAADLKFLFEKTSFAVSNDFSTRISLTGVSWEKKDDNFIMVGTDGHKLGKSWKKISDIKLKNSIIVPPRSISQILKTVNTETGICKISVGSANMKLECEDVVIYSKLIEGPYPDYDKVLPAELTKSIVINREEFISVLKRVATMAQAKTKQVKFVFNKDSLLLSARNQDLGGDSEESLPAKYDGKEISVGYNATYVLEVFRLIDSEEVMIKLNSNLGATVFEPVKENPEYFFIVMPLRLMEDE